MFQTILLVAFGLHAYANNDTECELNLRANKVAHFFDQPYIVEGKSGRKTPLFTAITKSNIEFLFSHQYDSNEPNLYGAKGIVVHEIFGGPQVYFFRSGDGPAANNIHHRDALSFVMKENARFARHWHETMMSLFLNHGDRFNLPSQPPPSENQLELWFDGLFTFLEHFDDTATSMSLRGINRELHLNSIARSYLQRTQGFQLSARRRDGALTVTDFRVDSSLTAMQIASQVPLNADEQMALIDLSISKIARRLRSFKKPKWPEGLNWKEDEN